MDIRLIDVPDRKYVFQEIDQVYRLEVLQGAVPSSGAISGV